jgi:hypothetical protein
MKAAMHAKKRGFLSDITDASFRHCVNLSTLPSQSKSLSDFEDRAGRKAIGLAKGWHLDIKPPRGLDHSNMRRSVSPY